RNTDRVQHDARAIGLATGENRRMTGRGLGIRVILIGVRVNRAALDEPREARLILAAETFEVIVAHLVDGDRDDQPRRCGNICRAAATGWRPRVLTGRLRARRQRKRGERQPLPKSICAADPGRTNVHLSCSKAMMRVTDGTLIT